MEDENVLTYVQLDKEAELIPIGAEGLLAVETFQGSRTPGKHCINMYGSKHVCAYSMSMYGRSSYC